MTIIDNQCWLLPLFFFTFVLQRKFYFMYLLLIYLFHVLFLVVFCFLLFYYISQIYRTLIELKFTHSVRNDLSASMQFFGTKIPTNLFLDFLWIASKRTICIFFLNFSSCSSIVFQIVNTEPETT